MSDALPPDAEHLLVDLTIVENTIDNARADLRRCQLRIVKPLVAELDAAPAGERTARKQALAERLVQLRRGRHRSELAELAGAIVRAERRRAVILAQLERYGQLGELPAASGGFTLQGTHDPQRTYARHDVVALDGGSFAAKRDNPGPCPGDGWQLATRQVRSRRQPHQDPKGSRMNILKRLLPNNTPTTAAEIAAALEAARAERTAAAAEQAALADRRAEALVTGTDSAVDKVEGELAAAARKVDRLDATIARLEARHREAEKAEATAALEAQAAEAQRAVADLADIYGRIDTATAELQRLFDEAKPLAATVDRWNQAGHTLGRPHLTYTRLDVVKQRTAGGIRL